ncbi:MAG: hypothetical protein IJ486_04455 [Firmicutes bacterium]|nr:hypothetical protein [Bacillota bacterium]
MNKVVTNQLHKRIEKIKDIILVVLFFSTILLLYFFWENQSLQNFQLPDIVSSQEEYETIPLDDVIVPDNIYASSGNGVYVKVYGGKRALWQRGIAEIQKFGTASSIFVGEITKEQYLEAMRGFTSVQFDLGYEVPFDQFCDYYKITRSQSFDTLEGVSAIAYSAASSESLFIVQEQKGKYYRLVADSEYTQLRSIAEEIVASDEASYYTISEVMGVENATMIPWEASVSYGPLQWETERQRGTDEDVLELAQSFFGENFDFIRRMVDTKGNVTYMYGYGQKTFITYADGTFEYKEEAGNTPAGSASFYKALDTALQYVSAHGSWNTFDEEDVQVFLSRAVPAEQNKQKGYRFEFGLMAGDLPVYYGQGVPLVVEVINGHVTYYSRSLIQYDLPEVQDVGVQTNVANVIASNYRGIYQLLHPQTAETDAPKEEWFDEVVAGINDVRLGYYRAVSLDESDEQNMVPAWVVTVDNRLRVYFDVNSGELIGSRTLS